MLHPVLTSTKRINTEKSDLGNIKFIYMKINLPVKFYLRAVQLIKWLTIIVAFAQSNPILH